MRLYIIRHAESTNNVLYRGSEDISGRSPDPEITDLGHKQAELLSQHLASQNNEPRQHPYDQTNVKNFGLTHLYCSLMTRSVLTADYISKASGLTVQALPDIFEKEGIFKFNKKGNKIGLPGPNREYFVERFPNLALPKTLSSEGWWSRPVETEQEFLERVTRSLANIARQHAHTDDRVAMVSHGDYIDQCINELFGVSRKQENYKHPWVANWVFHNTSVSRIDFENGSQNVVYLNRIDHLPPELITW